MLSAIAIAGAAALAGAAPAAAISVTTLTVNGFTDNTNACSVSGNTGTCPSLRSAVNFADNAGGPFVINLPAGHYSLTMPFGEGGGGHLRVADGAAVTINGAGASSTVVEASTLRDSALVVESGGNATLQNVTFDGGSGFFVDAGVIANFDTLILSDATISGGIDHATGGAGVFNAGTLHVQSGTVIRGNAATQDGSSPTGGGIWNQGTADITGAQIIGNASFGSGGGIYNDLGGQVTVTDTTIAGNNAGSMGGGIYNLGTVSMTGGQISGNEADTGQGGGVFNQKGGTLTLTGVMVSGNSADTGGGGIANSAVIDGSSGVNISGSTIAGNAAVSNGGGIMNTGDMTITGSTVSGNSVNSLGGGIYNSDHLTMLNSTIARNSTRSSDASGLYNDNPGTATLSFVTIADNPGLDGSANLATATGATTNLVSSILAYAPGQQCSGGGTVNDVHHNVFTDNTCDVEAPAHDPQLLPLSENTTNVPQTMAIFSTDNSPSPAILAEIGSCKDFSNNTVSVDENGNPRPTTVVESHFCDAGAFQLQTDVSNVSLGSASGADVVLTVMSGGETPQPAYGDGFGPCTVGTTSGTCPTLRAAVMYADTHATTSFDINLNTGEYQLVGEGGALPIGTESTPNVTIAGAGPGQTVIEGAAFVGPLGDDIFSIAPGAHLTLQQLTVDGGNGGSRDGSGAGDIFNQGTLLTSNTTVAGGSTTGEGIGGGGILNFGGADLSLGSGSTVDGNVASSSHGGGLANAGTATLTDATISDNQAAGGGGGIYNEGALTVTGGHLNSNSSPAGGQGGGILNTPFGGLSLSGTTLAGNSVLNDGQGGAVYNASSIHWTRPSPLPPVTGALLSQVTITGSSANRHVDTEGTGEGGAIYNAGEATMRITDSNLVGNGADSNGGAIFNSGSLNVDHTTLALNSVIDQWAGGIYDTASGQLTLSNSTLSGNSVVGNGSQFEGTALYKDQNATATLSFDTFAGNPGAHNAATIYSGESPSLVLSSDILAYGTGTQCIVHLSVMVDGGGNIASDDSCTALAGTETNKDPILLPLQFVGETTLPVMPLIATSPAINTTTGQSCTAGEATFTDDEIGQSRPSTVNGTSGCDAGAFQLAAQEQPPPPPAAGPVASPTPPTVTAVSPAFGPPAGGNTVAITGTGFSTASGGTVFDFGSNTATNVSCSSSTSCNVTAPAGALGSVDVTATVGGLTSATNPGDVYTYEVSQQQIVCSTNQDTRFVCQAYLDMQGRTVDPQGVLTWANGLIAGTLTRPQVVLGIDQSVEYRLGLIQSWFRSYLNRSADTGALTTFLTVLESGATQEQVQSFILGSPEYFAAAGGTNSGFLSKLYEQVLNRPIDPTGSASWLAALSHLSRQQVALALLSSPEYQTQLVSSWYERFLHRAVDPGSLAAWVNAMGHGMSDEVVLSGIVGSDEYFSHV